MILRVILSLAMLVPALPLEADCGDCPFMSLDECRAWLDACCGAVEGVEAVCGMACVEGGDEIVDACGSAGAECPSTCESAWSCCVDGLDAPNADGCCSDSPCSNDAMPCNQAEAATGASATTVCLWCVCCPAGRPRLPEPQPTPMAQRTPTEKEKVKDDAGSRWIASPVISPALPALANEMTPVPPGSRQAVLCIWRN